MMRRFLTELSIPRFGAAAVVTLAAIGLAGPGETKLEISDTAHPPVSVSDQVAVATVDPAERGSTADTTTTTGTPSPSTSPGPVATATTYPPTTRGQSVQHDPPPPPPRVGLHDLPFAPEHLDGCDEMTFYRRQAGLPERFDRVGFRESSCRNWVTSWTGCCHGWWQIHELHIGEPYLDRCGIGSVDDMRGRTAVQKQRQACAAAAVYVQQGPSAWEATW